VLPHLGRPSLLFGPSHPRRSLLFGRAPHGRCAHVVSREAAIARYLASLPAGATVTVCEVLREVPGLRLQPSQGYAVATILRALGWRAGKGCAEFAREGHGAPQKARCGSRVHPAIVAALPRIAAHLARVAPGDTTSEAEVCQAAGIELRGHHRRAVGRHLRRIGWRPVGRGSPHYRREGEA